MKSLLIGVLVVAFVAVCAQGFAVPTLQLYVEGAEYDDVTETWVSTNTNPFTLLVAGATSPSWVNLIDEVTLYFAIMEEEYDLIDDDLSATIISIVDNDPNLTFSYDIIAGDFISGTPDALSPHGIYPTYYASAVLPDLLEFNADEVVYDYNSGYDPLHPELSGSDLGDIQYYSIDYNSDLLSYLHTDLSGVITKKNGGTSSVFAPYSHDAESMVPEPVSALLLASGLLGIGILRRKKK